MFVHSVYFWLREDLTEDEIKRFENALQSLVSIDSVKSGYLGLPASTNRPIIDRSYSYGLICVFEDQAAHDAYQIDPEHERFREEFAPYWSDIKIYDFVRGAP